VATALVGLLEDAPVFLGEVRRVLSPGGHAVLTFTNRSSVLHRVDRFARPRRQTSPLVLPARAFSRREAVRALEGAGLVVVEMRFYNFFVVTDGGTVPPRRLALTLERVLENWAGEPLARNFLVVATAY
jgi:hypothetical protein